MGASRNLILAIASYGAATVGMIVHAAPQAPQPKAEPLTEAQLQAEATKNWAKIWPNLFGEPYSDGAVCSSALLKGAFCQMRRGDFTAVLQFYTAPPGVSHK